MTKATVLLTSAGLATASNVIDALRADADLDCRIVAVDKSPYAAGLHRADAWTACPACASPDYADTLLELCRREGVDFIFPLYSGETELFCREAERFRKQGARLMLPPLETARLCTDKPAFARFLAQRSFACPRTCADPDAADLRFPLILKPASGSGSRGVHRIDAAADLAYHRGRNPGGVLQEFIAGTEYTVDCLVDQGRLLACVPRERVLVKDGKTMVGRTAEHPRLRAETARLLAALGMQGPCNVQFIEDAAGELFVIEVNPRLAAGGLPLTVRAGANIPAMMLRLALGLPVAPAEDYRRGLVMTRYLGSIFLAEGPHGLERVGP